MLWQRAEHDDLTVRALKLRQKGGFNRGHGSRKIAVLLTSLKTGLQNLPCIMLVLFKSSEGTVTMKRGAM